MDVQAALGAIGGTSKGRCWYCDLKLPSPEAAVRAGWDVQRVEEHPVASIILVCPACQRENAELGEREFLRRLSLRASHVA